MKTNGKLEHYLEEITPPSYESAAHRCRLRSQVLDQLAANRASNFAKPGWRVIAIVAGLLCAGALVAQVVIQVQHYFFEGRTRDGAYQFSTPLQTLYVGTNDGPTGSMRGMTVVQKRTTSVGAEELGPGGVEQMRKDLEEMDLLKQKGVLEIIGVTDTQVNGHNLGRVLECKYVLADGRVKTMREAESDSTSAASPDQIEKDMQEIAQLRQMGQREVTTVIDTEVAGRIHRTLACLYVLSDGRQITVGEGDPSSGTSGQILTEAQQSELGRLQDHKAGIFMGTVQKQLFGRDFIFQRYSYTLSDGTVAIHAEGQPLGLKRNLSEQNWDELATLRKAGTGELLGNYEQEVQGKMFNFEKRRYLLTDGTEVIRANGVPKGGN